MIDELMQRLGMTPSGKMADEALSNVDWNALHERSQSTFDRVRNGGSLALESGMQQAPPVSAMDRYKQYIPPQQARGPVETIKDAFSLRNDEQGNPQAPGVRSYLNAALWALPGARGGRSGPAFAAEKGVGSGGMKAEPGPSPEKIVDAAIRTDKGIFRGSTHATASVRAEDAGVNISKLNLADADGFLTSTGRYVSREEAAKIANAIGQTRKPGVQKLESSVTSYPWQSDK